MKRTMCVGMWLAMFFLAVGLASARAGLIEGGDFSDPNFVNGKPQQTFTQGEWTYYEGSNMPCDVVGTGADRHAEINKESVYWNSSAIWYTGNNVSPTNATWTVSADLRGSYQTYQPMTFQLLDASETVQFELKFSYLTLSWIAGSQSGSFTSASGLDTTWRNASISYDPVTGSAQATFGNETVFSNVTTDAGLAIKQIKFGVWSYPNTGTLSIDNVSFVPEPVTLLTLILGSIGFFARRKM